MHSPSRFAAALLAGLLSTVALADVEVQEAYVRATPPGMNVTAAFLRLQNNGGDNIALTGARSEAAGTVELHTHSEQDGVMRMRRIDGIEIPAHQSHWLKPGSDHLMLIDLKRPLHEGDSVELTLQFSSGGQVLVTAPVRSAVQEMQVENHHHHDMPEPGRQ